MSGVPRCKMLTFTVCKNCERRDEDCSTTPGRKSCDKCHDRNVTCDLQARQTVAVTDTIRNAEGNAEGGKLKKKVKKLEKELENQQALNALLEEEVKDLRASCLATQRVCKELMKRVEGVEESASSYGRWMKKKVKDLGADIDSGYYRGLRLDLEVGTLRGESEVHHAALVALFKNRRLIEPRFGLDFDEVFPSPVPGRQFYFTELKEMGEEDEQMDLDYEVDEMAEVEEELLGSEMPSDEDMESAED
ncbi:hypothetical protein B0H13DRAFT_1909689 [Mycena leptocephala]|nr:hypothetical protein B0H13DRAFT_1909689 [Mycena leptocephala]